MDNRLAAVSSNQIALETLEFILGKSGEVDPEPVYQSTIPMYQPTIVPTASTLPFNKYPSAPVGLKSSAPSEVLKETKRVAAQVSLEQHTNIVVNNTSIRNGIVVSVTELPIANATTSIRAVTLTQQCNDQHLGSLGRRLSRLQKLL